MAFRQIGADMLINERDIRSELVLDAAKRMLAAARTAPKGKGMDVIECVIATDEDLERIAEKMRDLSAEMNLAFLSSNADNIEKGECLLLIGTGSKPHGLNCGNCGFPTCGSKPKEVPCELNSVDVGIALGSASATAADCRVDTRIMFSAGYAAQKLGMLGDGVDQVFAIAISESSKSPFFDRSA